MAVVGTAYVRLKLMTDNLESQIKKAVERSISKADLGKIGNNAGRRIGEEIADAIPEPLIERKVKDAIEDGIDKANKTATIDPEVDGASYTARINWLTRPRIQQILIRINNKSLAGFTEFINRASGLRNISDMAENLFRRIWNLDKTAPILGLVASGILAISAAAGSAVGWIGLASTQLATLAGLLIPLPALMIGGGAAIATLVVGLKDMGERLKDLGPRFKTLGKSMSSKFWAQAEKPIRNMVNNLLPMFNERLTSMSTAMGTFIGAAAEAFGSTENVGRLTTIFEATEEAIRLAIPGIEKFIDGFLRLGAAGSRYLPRLGKWFTDLGERFDAWVKRNEESGKLFDWVEGGIQTFTYLKEILGGLIGIFGGIGSAAEAAGGGGLKTVADSLGRLSDAINSVAGQEALTKFFMATEEATTRLGDGIGDLLGSIGNSMDTIEVLMITASDAIANALGGIGDIIESAGFQDGLTGLVDGFHDFINSLVPMAPEIGSIIGSIMQIAGDFLTNFGPVLASAIEALEPLISELADGLKPVIEDLAGGLTSALEYLSPIIERVAPHIGDFVEKFGTWIVVGGAAVGVFDKIGGGLKKLDGFGTLGTKIAGVAGKFSPVLVKAIQAVFGVITKHPIVAAITAAVAGLTWFFTKTETGQAIVSKAWEFIQKAIQKVTDWWNNTAMPLLTAGWDAIKGAAQGFADWFGQHVTPIFQSMADLWSAAWARIQPILNVLWESLKLIGDAAMWLWNTVLAPFGAWLGGVFAAAWDGIKAAWEAIEPYVVGALTIAWENFKTFFSGLWDSIVIVVEGALAGVKIVIDTITAAINGDWSAVWQGIKDYFGNIWNTIVELGRTWLETLKGYLSNIWDQIGGTVTSVWDSITSFLSGIWNSIVTYAAGRFAAIRDTISNIWNTIKTVSSAVWNSIVSFITGIPGRIMAGLANLAQLGAKAAEWVGGFVTNAKTKFNEAVDFVKGIPQKILNALGNVGTFLKDSGRKLIDGFKDGIVNGFNKARDAVRDGIQKIRDFFPFSPAKVGPFSGKGYTTVSGAKLMADFGVGISKGSQSAIKAGLEAFQRVNGSFYTAQVQGAEQRLKAAQQAYSKASKSSKKNYKAAVDRAKAHLDTVKKTTSAAIAADKKLISSGEEVDKAFAAIVKKIQTAQLNIAKIMRNDYWAMTKGTAKNAGNVLTKIVEELYKVGTPATKALANYVNAEKKTLTGMMATRETVRKRLVDANKHLSTLLADQSKYVQSLYEDSMNFSSVFEEKTADDMLTSMRKQIEATTAFRKNLEQLAKLGLSTTMLDMIAQSGVEAGNKSAEALLKGGKKAITEMNGLEKQLGKEAKSLSDSMGKQMYDAGIEAARGLVAGLKKQDNELTKAIEAMAVSIYANLKKVLKIKSPSRVMMGVGEDAAAGVPIGLLSQLKAIKNASTTIGKAMIPTTTPVDTSRLAAATVGAPAAGSRSLFTSTGEAPLFVDKIEMNITADDLADLPVVMERLRTLGRTLRQGRVKEKV